MVASLVAVVSWHVYSSFLLPEHAEAFDVDAFGGARRIGEPVQPSAEIVERISKVVRDPSPSPFPAEIRAGNVALIDGIPYFPYWQDSEKLYRFHPMGYGGFISNLAGHQNIDFYIDRMISVAHESTDDGYLWFYPDTWPVARMIGKVLPSAIGQGQMIAGIVDASVMNHGKFNEVAAAAFRGLAFDYYEGGTNLEGRALLEIPLFRSAPEIILNGWLHALILVYHYAEWSDDPAARLLIGRNIDFLAESLGGFHDERTGLSLYSDLSPYKIKISYRRRLSPSFYAYYDSRSDELDDIVIPLEVLPNPDMSPYDNQIVAGENGRVQARVSCSQNYDTYIVSDEGEIKVSLLTGRYDPMRATPASGGTRIDLVSAEKDGWHVVALSSVRERLYCGFPTNFAKFGNENYYHIYHIVALAYILATFELEEGQAEILQEWLRTWCDTVDALEHTEGRGFSDFGSVLEGLAAHHRQIRYEDWGKLLEDVKSRWGQWSSACG